MTKNSSRLASPPEKISQKEMAVPASAITTMLRMTSDWILLIDREGLLLGVEHQQTGDGSIDFATKVGKSCFELITSESRRKLENMLKQAEVGIPGQWRQLNHPRTEGSDLPVRYSTIALDADQVLLVGQSMMDLADIQQRLVRAQQAIEGDLAQLSQSKMRYQLVFDLASDALLTVDADSNKIMEANPAAQRLLGHYIAPLTSNRFPTGFDPDSTAALEGLFSRARQAGRAEDVAVRTADEKTSFLASVTLIRELKSSSYLVRLSPLTEAAPLPVNNDSDILFGTVVNNSPDAFVICEFDGSIVATNEAFATMAQMPSIDALVGENLDRWLGRTGLDQQLLSNNVRQHGHLEKFSTVINGEYGTSTNIEVSAGAIADPVPTRMVLVARNIESRHYSRPPDELLTPNTGPPMTDLVGRVPLKELVRQSTDLIEKMCIEAALELTSDNRASAAEMLGVSRQSLYVKLRRFGLSENPAEQQQARQ